MSTTETLSKPRILVERPGKYALLLQTAFSQVCDPEDWRGPINCLVPWEAAATYIEAIRYMTATPVNCEREVIEGETYAHITSVGYRMGPAGP